MEYLFALKNPIKGKNKTPFKGKIKQSEHQEN